MYADPGIIEIAYSVNKYNKIMTGPPIRTVYLKIIFLISLPKHMLWLLKRTVSYRQFF